MSRLTTTLAGAAVLLLAVGCRSTHTVSPGAVAIPSPGVIPAGTPLGLRLEQRLGLDVSDVGDPFRTTVASLVVTEGGALVVPAGTEVFGTVTGLAPPAGGQPAAIRLAFDRIVLRGEEYPLAASVVRTDVAAEGGDAARGRVLTGARRDALAAGALGAEAGTAISLGTDAEKAALDVGTLLVVTTDRQLVLR